jgi:alkylation response protein AidB-like acyl-CoA dehydrogenase
MAIMVDGARFTSYEAIWRLSEGLPARKELAVAKAFTSDAYREVTLTAHQVHGGIGYMNEFDLQFYSRRAKAIELKLGTPPQHLATVASEMGL